MADRAGIPGWVKVAGIITVVLVLIFVVLLLQGGHGPQQHIGSPGPRAASSFAA